MVIVRLMGGLGNPLFQYALGRTVAEKRATTLDEIRRLRGGWIAGRLPRHLQKLNPFRKRSHILERSFSFDPEVLDAADEPVRQEPDS
jgi:hypothetical protein